MPIYQRGSAAYARMFNIYQEPIEVSEGTVRDLQVPSAADIALKHLSFRYPGTSYEAINDVSLTIRGGSMAGITGPLASGKTTLLRLLVSRFALLIITDSSCSTDARYGIQPFPFGSRW